MLWESHSNTVGPHDDVCAKMDQKSNCSRLMHHNRSQRDEYIHTHAFHQYQWQGGQRVLLPGRVLGML
jgi:hypothetical protein